MNMKQSNRWIVMVVMVTAVLFLAACGGAEEVTKIEPSVVELVSGTEFNRVVLTERAVQRLDIQTDSIREAQVNGVQETVVPYAAVIYGLNGETWVYTMTAPRTYSRALIMIDYIEGDMAVLADGPPIGTEVVIVGVAELYGTDTGVGK